MQRTELSRPDVSAEEARALFSAHYGLSGPIVELGSQQDRNYRIETPDGRFVLKICQAAYAMAELEAQNAALHHIAGKVGTPLVPRVIPATSGKNIVPVTVRGQDYQIRLLDYIDGEPLTRRKHLSTPTVTALGTIGGQLARALSDFNHPGLARAIQWDLRHAAPVVLHLLSAVKDEGRKDRIAQAIGAALKRIEPLKPSLRLQAIHHDITDDNVVARPDESGRLIPMA